jgi:hypothetical protein
MKHPRSAFFNGRESENQKVVGSARRPAGILLNNMSIRFLDCLSTVSWERLFFVGAGEAK